MDAIKLLIQPTVPNETTVTYGALSYLVSRPRLVCLPQPAPVKLPNTGKKETRGLPPQKMESPPSAVLGPGNAGQRLLGAGSYNFVVSVGHCLSA